MKGFIKTFLMIYAMTAGFWITFVLVYAWCGYELTNKALWWLFDAAFLVEVVYVKSITVIKRK